jgi:exodeoxyribonuclease III
MKRILSYNLNGIRSALSKGLIEWLDTENFDVLCFQETKAQADQVDLTPFLERGFYPNWHSAQKKGYSGVLTLSKMQPDLVEAGIGLPQYDQEGRILRTDFGNLTLLNCYFPSGTTGDVRQEVKMNFLTDFYEWVLELRKSRPNIIIVGDYNIAHNEIDIHDPKGNKKSSGFLPEERAWMDLWFANGFIDTFRYKYPERVGYSWWTFRANARANNKGWRIDYISVTAPLKDTIHDAGLFPKIVHSDHCGVWLTLA